MMAGTALLRLQAGELVAEIAPALGGAIASFFSQLPGARIDWLRPASAEALATGDRLGLASFPLVPWCNRIRDGRARHGERAVRLPPHRVSRHPLHGLGWDAAWTVDAAHGHSATLSFEADAGGWPWAFRAEQRFELGAEGLAVTLSVENRDTVPMPAGIGHHPYFALGAEATLQAEVGRRWLADAELLPHTLADDPLVPAMSTGVPMSGVVIDGVFTHWRRRATLAWPATGASLAIEAEAPFDFLHLYRPPGGGFFCVEPVSNVTDWLNMPADDAAAPVGGAVLAPGERLAGRCLFRPGLPASQAGARP